MPSKLNQEMLEKASQALDSSAGVFVIDYRGLTVKETQEFRRALSAAGSHMKVFKNNIMKIALAKAGLPAIDETLVGTCAYIFFEKDAVEAAKIIKSESQRLKKIEVLGGIADGQALDAEAAKAYAELASRDELIAQLVYVVASPLRGIASVCAGPARGLATVLKAIQEQKEAA